MTNPTLPAWVLTEEVDVTPAYRPHPDICNFEIYLLERVAAHILPGHTPNAVTITFDDGTVEINGVVWNWAESAALTLDLERLCSLVDEAGRIASPDNLQPIGMTIRTQARSQS